MEHLTGPIIYIEVDVKGLVYLAKDVVPHLPRKINPGLLSGKIEI